MRHCCQPLVGLLAAVAVIAGCVVPDAGGPSKPNQRLQGVLAASRAKQISLFGDLPGGIAPTYFTRAAMSLRQHSFTEVGNDFDTDGTGKTRLTDGHTGNHAPTFSPDDRVFFSSDRSGRENTWSLLLPSLPMTSSQEDVLTTDTIGVEPNNREAARTASASDDL